MRIALVAGEASGDLLGAGLIRAIQERVPKATFEGVAGPEMIAAGCTRIEDSEALAVTKGEGVVCHHVSISLSVNGS